MYFSNFYRESDVFHGLFSRAEQVARRNRALAPAMTKPARNADRRTRSVRRAFSSPPPKLAWDNVYSRPSEMPCFWSTCCDRMWRSGSFFCTISWSCQIIVHLLMTVHGDMTIEKAMQLIKGGFSYRLKREFQYLGEVWQRGFSEMRADDEEEIFAISGIHCPKPGESGTGRISRAISLLLQLFGKEEGEQGLKPGSFCSICGTTEVVP